MKLLLQTTIYLTTLTAAMLVMLAVWILLVPVVNSLPGEWFPLWMLLTVVVDAVLGVGLPSCIVWVGFSAAKYLREEK